LYARSKGRRVLDAAPNALSDNIDHRLQFSINIVVDKIAYTFCRDPIIPIRELRKHGILRAFSKVLDVGLAHGLLGSNEAGAFVLGISEPLSKQFRKADSIGNDALCNRAINYCANFQTDLSSGFVIDLRRSRTVSRIELRNYI
jgi:hypothetical protein